MCLVRSFKYVRKDVAMYVLRIYVHMDLMVNMHLIPCIINKQNSYMV